MSGSSRPGGLLETPGNRRPRGMAVTRGACPAPYRTRLTGRLIDEGARRGNPPGPAIWGAGVIARWRGVIPTCRLSDSGDSQISCAMIYSGKRRFVCHGSSHCGANGLFEQRGSPAGAAGEGCGAGAPIAGDRGGAGRFIARLHEEFGLSAPRPTPATPAGSAICRCPTTRSATCWWRRAVCRRR